MRVSLVQMSPVLYDKRANLKALNRHIDLACANKANLIVFPELCLTGYMCKEAFHDLAEPIPGRSTMEIVEKAQKSGLYVLLGMPEKRDSAVYNSAAMIGPRGLIGVWRKMFLPHFVSATGIHYQEKSYFNAGEQLGVFDTGLGKIGVEICYEIWYPEISRAHALQGAWLLLNISAAPRGVPTIFRQLGQVRAMENICWFGYVNQVGSQEDVTFGGGTCMIDCYGVITHSASLESDAGEEVISCDITAKPILERRKELPVLEDHQPQLIDMYSELS